MTDQCTAHRRSRVIATLGAVVAVRVVTRTVAGTFGSSGTRKVAYDAVLSVNNRTPDSSTSTGPSRSGGDHVVGYVGLTFDDGPNPGTTANLLNALTANGLRATMFNIGQQAQSNPALVRAQHDAGMWIGNHSWTHPHLVTMADSEILAELRQSQAAIERATGTAPRLFRPPYGESSVSLRSVERQLGLTEIIWDVDSRDWNGASTAQIVQAVDSLQNGQIILMHDQYASTLAAIPQIAANLRSRNLCAGMISPATGHAVAPDNATQHDGDWPTVSCRAG